MMNSKRGSSAVFLTVILASLMAITLSLIYAVREETVKSRSDGIINLAMDSVMSEFNIDVEREYGLFMMDGSDAELTGKLYRYISYSTDDMEGVSIDSINASGAGFYAGDTGQIKRQIISYMKLRGMGKIAEKTIYTGKEVTGKSDDISERPDRSLRYGPVISSLPSGEVPKQKLTALAESIAEKGRDIGRVFTEGSEKYMINEYITTHFNSKGNCVSADHFFNNEIEYILGGELTDRKNEKRVEIALKAMFFPINLAHIYQDPQKREATLAAAELITPGAAAAATQLVIATTWAYAEADNDVELLWQGHKVPMIKDKDTWAIDLDSAVEGLTGGTVVPDVEKGYDYRQYLQILMFFQEENMKLARILDLIQINMRCGYDEDFLINEQFTGMSVNVTINGRSYGYEKKY